MSLSRIQSLRLAAVLEDCSDQLDILGEALTVQISRERSAAGVQEKDRLTILKGDCQYISQLVSKLSSELEGKQTFTCLLQAVEAEDQKRNAENIRREAQREMERSKLTLQKQQEELQQKQQKLQELSLLAKDLRLQLDQQLSRTDRKKLVEKNIELQIQRTKSRTGQAEVLLEEQRELLKKQLEQEMAVQGESMKRLQDQHEEMQQQLQQWQQHTKQQLQEKVQQLNNVDCKRALNLDKLMEMRRKYKEMEQVVLEDREEQEKLRQQQAQAAAATKLQAWWRGCMVRRGLGRFKKTVGNKKVKKKKKTGKKQ